MLETAWEGGNLPCTEKKGAFLGDIMIYFA